MISTPSPSGFEKEFEAMGTMEENRDSLDGVCRV